MLALAVKKSLESNCINIEDPKFLIKECLRRKACDAPELMPWQPCIDILEGINDIKNLFDFLADHYFIGYLNYKLLEVLIQLVKDDNEIWKLFSEYEKAYAKFLSAVSFKDFLPLFEEIFHQSPTAPFGLPCISFHLEEPWLVTTYYTWVSTFGELSWSDKAFLKQLQNKCIIITYAILPCVLDDVMRDLKDPLILKKLEDKGVTVIELPQEEKGEMIHCIKLYVFTIISQNIFVN